ncbi:hypothetical protein F25303_10531 [Fusarium sp. NRRL 25303]|nr:hypothetical protein F25303_10531 [Fusarium sp. NRRL 25303]
MQNLIHRILGWNNEVESCDQNEDNKSIHSPSNSSSSDDETSNDSYGTASDGESDASTATIGRSMTLEPIIPDISIDSALEKTLEDAGETANPHPSLSIKTEIAREAIYIYEIMKEGAIDDTWNSKSCLLTRAIIHDEAAPPSGRLCWRCDVSYDPEDVEAGDVVVLFMPDRDFVKMIEQGEVVFDQPTDPKPISVLSRAIDPDSNGPEQRLAGRVLAWKVFGSGDCDWMDRQGRPIDPGDLEVVPNIIHLLK